MLTASDMEASEHLSKSYFDSDLASPVWIDRLWGFGDSHILFACGGLPSREGMNKQIPGGFIGLSML